MLARVIRTGAGMVMAFDRAGRQLPDFQGPYDKIKAEVFRGASSATVFEHWFGTEERPDAVPAGQW
jgi:hypothetical protein